MKDLIEEAKTIFLQTLRGIDLEPTFKGKIHRNGNNLHVEDEVITLSAYQRILLIGMGKASQQMGFLVEQLLEDRLEQGILVTNHRSNLKVKSDVIVASHPVPDRNSFEAGKRIINLINSSDSKTLIIFVISGGGSSLVETPIFDEISLEDVQKLNQLLISCGASIREINVIRKFLSLTKGGRLGNLAKKSHCLGLFLSDVNYGDLQALASNPLLPDNATLEEFYQIIENYALFDHLPYRLASLIGERKVPPLPLHWQSDDRKQIKLLLLENRDALALAAEKAKSLGFEVWIEHDLVEGDYREIADQLIRRLSDYRSTVQRAKICLISGGEVSCLVKGTGLGGRNQEFVLYCASELARSGVELCAILACGTDGIDGNSAADGAVADAFGIRLVESIGVKRDIYYQENDTHSFFREFGGLLTSGPTGTNVRDVRILIAR